MQLRTKILIWKILYRFQFTMLSFGVIITNLLWLLFFIIRPKHHKFVLCVYRNLRYQRTSAKNFQSRTSILNYPCSTFQHLQVRSPNSASHILHQHRSSCWSIWSTQNGTSTVAPNKEIYHAQKQNLSLYNKTLK